MVQKLFKSVLMKEGTINIYLPKLDTLVQKVSLQRSFGTTAVAVETTLDR